MKKFTNSSLFLSFFACLFTLLGADSAFSQTYTTIADGNWNTAATWQGGVIPPTGSDIPATAIINIRHTVNYNTGNPIKNRGTIRMQPITGTTARLNIPTGISIENYAASPLGFYMLNATFSQCRFANCNNGEPYTGNAPGAPKNSGTFKNIGGYNEVLFSNFEIAQDWVNEGGGTRIIQDSCVFTGQNFSLSGPSRDELTRTTVSVGWHTSGNFSVADGTAVYNLLSTQLAGTSGSFQLNSGTVNGSINSILLRNQVVPFTGGGLIEASSSVTTLGINLNTYCANTFIQNGKFTGNRTSNCGASVSCSSVPSVSIGISGNVFNDTNGLTDSTVNGTGTNAGGPLYVNLINAGNNVVQTTLVQSNGTYSFTNLNAGGYTLQLSTNQGTVGSPPPVLNLPTGWVNTGENLGAGAGSDGNANGLLAVTLSSVALTNANFGIEQRPVANNNTAATQNNPGGTISAPVPATTFSATDTAPGTVTNIRITSFPTNATSIAINSTLYTSATFPAGGVIVPANTSGNPTQSILVDPTSNGATTVVIPYVAIDNANVESSAIANANVPFSVATSGLSRIAGNLKFGQTALSNSLVVLFDTASGAKKVVRTDANGNYEFYESAGRTYIVQPLSSKYSFAPETKVINLVGELNDVDFASTAKNYRPKNDFDGDGISDIAIYRPSEGAWMVLHSHNNSFNAFRFGIATDVPVAADYDGDGKTDIAVFRPSEGTWYIWQSATQDLRAEKFGLAADKLVPADYDGDGRADLAVYRDGFWYVQRSSDNTFEARQFGISTDQPTAADFDGDNQADFAVYRPTDGTWYVLNSAQQTFSASKFGLATDVPVAADYDGDGFADVAQYRNGKWYVLNSTTQFQVQRLGSETETAVTGDYDGDGRADFTVYRDGEWTIRSSVNGEIKKLYFGNSKDLLIK